MKWLTPHSATRDITRTVSHDKIAFLHVSIGKKVSIPETLSFKTAEDRKTWAHVLRHYGTQSGNTFGIDRENVISIGPFPDDQLAVSIINKFIKRGTVKVGWYLSLVHDSDKAPDFVPWHLVSDITIALSDGFFVYLPPLPDQAMIVLVAISSEPNQEAVVLTRVRVNQPNSTWNIRSAEKETAKISFYYGVNVRGNNNHPLMARLLLGNDLVSPPITSPSDSTPTISSDIAGSIASSSTPTASSSGSAPAIVKRRVPDMGIFDGLPLRAVGYIDASVDASVDAFSSVVLPPNPTDMDAKHYGFARERVVNRLDPLVYDVDIEYAKTCAVVVQPKQPGSAALTHLYITQIPETIMLDNRSIKTTDYIRKKIRMAEEDDCWMAVLPFSDITEGLGWLETGASGMAIRDNLVMYLAYSIPGLHICYKYILLGDRQVLDINWVLLYKPTFEELLQEAAMYRVRNEKIVVVSKKSRMLPNETIITWYKRPTEWKNYVPATDYTAMRSTEIIQFQHTNTSGEIRVLYEHVIHHPEERRLSFAYDPETPRNRKFQALFLAWEKGSLRTFTEGVRFASGLDKGPRTYGLETMAPKAGLDQLYANRGFVIEAILKLHNPREPVTEGARNKLSDLVDVFFSKLEDIRRILLIMAQGEAKQAGVDPTIIFSTLGDALAYSDRKDFRWLKSKDAVVDMEAIHEYTQEPLATPPLKEALFDMYLFQVGQRIERYYNEKGSVYQKAYDTWADLGRNYLRAADAGEDGTWLFENYMDVIRAEAILNNPLNATCPTVPAIGMWEIGEVTRGTVPRPEDPTCIDTEVWIYVHLGAFILQFIPEDIPDPSTALLVIDKDIFNEADINTKRVIDTTAGGGGGTLVIKTYTEATKIRERYLVPNFIDGPFATLEGNDRKIRIKNGEYDASLVASNTLKFFRDTGLFSETLFRLYPSFPIEGALVAYAPYAIMWSLAQLYELGIGTTAITDEIPGLVFYAGIRKEVTGGSYRSFIKRENYIRRLNPTVISSTPDPFILALAEVFRTRVVAFYGNNPEPWLLGCHVYDTEFSERYTTTGGLGKDLGLLGMCLGYLIRNTAINCWVYADRNLSRAIQASAGVETTEYTLMDGVQERRHQGGYHNWVLWNGWTKTTTTNLYFYHGAGVFITPMCPTRTTPLDKIDALRDIYTGLTNVGVEHPTISYFNLYQYRMGLAVYTGTFVASPLWANTQNLMKDLGLDRRLDAIAYAGADPRWNGLARIPVGTPTYTSVFTQNITFIMKDGSTLKPRADTYIEERMTHSTFIYTDPIFATKGLESMTFVPIDGDQFPSWISLSSGSGDATKGWAPLQLDGVVISDSPTQKRYWLRILEFNGGMAFLHEDFSEIAQPSIPFWIMKNDESITYVSFEYLAKHIYPTRVFYRLEVSAPEVAPAPVVPAPVAPVAPAAAAAPGGAGRRVPKMEEALMLPLRAVAGVGGDGVAELTKEWLDRVTVFSKDTADSSPSLDTWNKQAAFVAEYSTQFLGKVVLSPDDSAHQFMDHTITLSVTKWRGLMQALPESDSQIKKMAQFSDYRREYPRSLVFRDHVDCYNTGIKSIRTLIDHLEVIDSQRGSECVTDYLRTVRGMYQAWMVDLALMEPFKCDAFMEYWDNPTWKCPQAKNRERAIKPLGVSLYTQALAFKPGDPKGPIIVERVLARMYDRVTLDNSIAFLFRQVITEWAFRLYDHLLYLTGTLVNKEVVCTDIEPDRLPRTTGAMLSRLESRMLGQVVGGIPIASYQALYQITQDFRAPTSKVTPLSNYHETAIQAMALTPAGAEAIMDALDVPQDSLDIGFGLYFHTTLLQEALLAIPVKERDAYLARIRPLCQNKSDSLQIIGKDLNQDSSKEGCARIRARLHAIQKYADQETSTSILREFSNKWGTFGFDRLVSTFVPPGALGPVSFKEVPEEPPEVLAGYDICSIAQHLVDGPISRRLALDQIDAGVFFIHPFSPYKPTTWDRFLHIRRLLQPGKTYEESLSLWTLRVPPLSLEKDLMIQSLDLTRGVLIDIQTPDESFFRGLEEIPLSMNLDTVITHLVMVMDSAGTIWIVDQESEVATISVYFQSSPTKTKSFSWPKYIENSAISFQALFYI